MVFKKKLLQCNQILYLLLDQRLIKMKIGLLGGTFNPAHQGHIYISNLALQKLGLNQVWWVVTAQNPLKDNATTPYKSRLEGCLQITKNQPKIWVKDFYKDSFFTYNLIKKLKKQYPATTFYFIAGDDILHQFHQWKNYKILPKMIKFVIFSRVQNFYNKIIYKDFLFFQTKKYNISSSEIRNKKL